MPRLALLLLILVGDPVNASDRQVTIVLSSDAAPFLAAQRALAEALGAHGIASAVRDPSAVDPPAPGVVVVAIGSLAAARSVETAERMVYCLVADPAEAGVAGRDGIRGVPMQVPLRDQLALCAQLLPRGRRIGMLYAEADRDSLALLAAARSALPPEWSLEAVAVDRHAGAADAIAELIDRRVDIVWTAPDPGIYSAATVRALLVAALRHRLPVFGFSQPFVRAGAVIGVGIDPAEHGRQAADLARRMLAGEPVTADPEPPYTVYVNRLVAEQIRLRIPPELRAVAEEVQHDGR